MSESGRTRLYPKTGGQLSIRIAEQAMREKGIRTPAAILLGFLALSALVWIGDTVLDALFFYKGQASFLELLVLRVPPHEIYIRLVIAALLLACAIPLSRLIRQRTGLQERLTHQNRVLTAIRNVNQLIAHEKDKDRLLNEVCRLLVETHGFERVWIVLTGDDATVAPVFHAGFNDGFAPLGELLQSGELPYCARVSLESGGAHVIEKPGEQCGDCPMVHKNAEHSEIAVHLKHGGQTFGSLAVTVPRSFARDIEEQDLVEELAGDIAYALASMDAETERERTEKTLHSREEFLDRIIEQSPFPTWIGDRHGVLQRANSALKRALNLTDEQLVGVYNILKDPQIEDQGLLPLVKSVFEKGEIVTFSAHWWGDDTPGWGMEGGRAVDIEATMYPVHDADGNMTHFVLHWVDVTERKRTAKALEENEARFRALFEKSPIGIAYHRMLYDDTGKPIDYIFLDANHNFLELTGVDPRGKRVTEAFPGIENDEFDWIGTYGKVARNGETIRFQRHLPQNDRWYDVVAFQTTPDHFVAAFLETTEQRHLEEQLRQAQKMEAVGQLAGGIAHDFNNLLQVITGYGEIAVDETIPGTSLHESVEEMMDAAERASNLVGQLLAFSRRQVLEMKDLDLNVTIGDMLKMLRRIIGEHVELRFLPGRDLGVVRADPVQVGQILTNLCVNARDAMPETGGTVAIETENVRIDEDYCRDHAWAEPGRYVLLSVTDSGCGMNAETLEHIFEPFFSTKEVGKGTGLGLSTVYGLVKQHQGSVYAYSEVGKGTTFKVYLPLVERRAQTVGSKIEGPTPHGAETILLAEDDDKVRELTTKFLTRAGYTVLTATDGEEALDVFRQNAEDTDMAILDVVMPRLGGRAVYEHIRLTHPHIPVLFTSGYSMNAIHTDFVLDEGLNLIQKPCNRDDLLRRVRGMLDDDHIQPAPEKDPFPPHRKPDNHAPSPHSL